MNTIHIRKADDEDLSKLLRLEQGIIEAERPFDSTLKENNIHYYNLPAMLQDASLALMVAEAGEEIVGCGYARIEKAKSYLLHSFHAYLGFMFVLPAYRGQGINLKIIDALKNWALSKGVTELRLEVYHENTAAIRAYEKAGFQPLMLQMRMQSVDKKNMQ